MEKNIVERGFATAEELKAGHATGAGKMLRRKLTVSLNDWWRWVIDFGAPGPDRLRRATAARRILCRALPHYSRLDPWSNVYPYVPGGEGTSIAEFLSGDAKLGRITERRRPYFARAAAS